MGGGWALEVEFLGPKSHSLRSWCRTARCYFTGPKKVPISAIILALRFFHHLHLIFSVFLVFLSLFPTVLYFLEKKLGKLKLYLLPTVYCMLIFTAVYTHRMFLFIHFSVLQCRMTLSVCPSPSRWNSRRFDKGRRR